MPDLIGQPISHYHILDRLGDLQGAAPCRALERHVFQKMRDAILLGPLMAATGGDPDADTGRFEARHVFGHDAQTVGKSVDLDSHWRVRSRMRVWIWPRSLATRVIRSGLS